MTTTIVDSPIGPLRLTAADGALTGLAFVVGAGPSDDEPHHGLLADVADQLSAYFAGERSDFDVPLAPRGTLFQRRVWAALLDVPYGTTVSYGELARRIGEPTASRAVGLANGQNPIAVIIPCHRVIGADGRLTGYGGGLPRKRHLLDLEQQTLFAV